jgi:hypothetical protein
MKIIVRGNCITGALAAGLEIMFPEASVFAIPGEPDETTRQQTESILSGADSRSYIVTQYPAELLHQVPASNIISVPDQTFNAFHPDLVYCRRASDGQLTIPHYNSRIVLQAFRMRIPVNRVSRLFQSNVYQGLGYFNYWNDATCLLSQRLFDAGYKEHQVRQFFRRLSRKGVFMHTVNHPTIDFLTELVKLIGWRIDPTRSSDSCVFNIADGLVAMYVYPVYPEIAGELGVRGSYVWAMGLDNYDLESFIRFSYGNYESQGFTPGDLMFDMNDQQQMFFSRIFGN